MRLLSILGVLFLWSNSLKGQYALGSLSISDGDISEWYQDRAAIQNTQLIVGAYYKFLPKTLNSHPFFIDKNWHKGDIKFRGHIYKDVNLLYQLEEDIILTNDPSNLVKFNQPITLNKQYVDWFKIDGHKFQLYNYKSNDSETATFHDIIYDGQVIKFYVKRSSKLQVKEKIGYYIPQYKFILSVNNETHTVKNRISWMYNMRTYKKALKPFMVKHQIHKFSETDYKTLQMLAEYSENLLSKQL